MKASHVWAVSLRWRDSATWLLGFIGCHLHASLSNTKAASFFIPLTHAFLMQQFKPSAYSCALTWHLPQIPAQRLSQLARGSQWSCGVITGWVWPCCPCLFCLWRCSINKQRFLQLYILYQYWNEEHMPLRFSNQVMFQCNFKNGLFLMVKKCKCMLIC